MNVILTTLLAVGLLTILYRFAVRPLLKSGIIERIESREKILDQLVESGTVINDDFSYQFLVKHCQIKNRLENCSVSDFVHFVFSKKVPKNLFDDLKRFKAEANSDMKALHEDLCKDMGLWLIINSPFYCILAVSGIVMAILLRYINETKVKNRAEAFVNAEASGCAA